MTARRIFTCNSPFVMRIDPGLAAEIGLNESIVLLQMEYLLSTTGQLIDGQTWIPGGANDLRHLCFPWWTPSTISRILGKLVDRGLLDARDDLNQAGFDHTRWYTLNHEGLRQLDSIAVLETTVAPYPPPRPLAPTESHTEAISPMTHFATSITQSATTTLQNVGSHDANCNVEGDKLQRRRQQIARSIKVEDHEDHEDHEEGTPARRKRRATPRPMTTKPEQLATFSEAWEIYIRLAGRQQFAASIKADVATTATDLTRWEKVVKAWLQCGHKATNIRGMLDWYEHPERVPGSTLGTAGAPAAPRPTREDVFAQARAAQEELAAGEQLSAIAREQALVLWQQRQRQAGGA